MLRVTIELIPKGNEREKRVVRIIEICNLETGTREMGNYSVKTRSGSSGRAGTLSGFARTRLGYMDLVYRALRTVVDEP